MADATIEKAMDKNEQLLINETLAQVANECAMSNAERKVSDNGLSATIETLSSDGVVIFSDMRLDKDVNDMNDPNSVLHSNRHELRRASRNNFYSAENERNKSRAKSKRVARNRSKRKNNRKSQQGNRRRRR